MTGQGGVLVTVGDLVEDVIVWHEAPTRYATDNPCVVRRSRGGSAANVAVFASRLMPARFIGCVGDDPVADLLTSELAGHGVDVRVQRRGRTGTIVVLVDSGGERTMYPDRAAAADLSEVPDAWLELVITEGRNRQVRRMTAAVGLPTLRLVRVAVGAHALDALAPGQWRALGPS